MNLQLKTGQKVKLLFGIDLILFRILQESNNRGKHVSSACYTAAAAAKLL